MNPEAIKHRNNIIIARQQFGRGEITMAELHAIVDAYLAWMVAKVGKKKAGRFTRAYILRSL